MARKRGRDEPEDVSATVDVSDTKRHRPTALRSGDEELSATDTASSSSSITSDDEEATGDEDEHTSEDETSSSGSLSSASSAESESEDELIAEEDSSHEQEHEGIAYVPGRPRPRIQRIQGLDQSDLMSRLSSFLPQLRAANEGLEREIVSGNASDVRMDDVQDGDEQYIEMNLGLGVLKETHGSNSDSDTHNEDDIDSAQDGTEPSDSRNSNVMSRLMGQSKRRKPGIEEVDDS